jgi:hypothetical protein
MAAIVAATLLVPLLRNVAPGKAPLARRIEPVSNDVHAGGGRRRQSVDIFAATRPKQVAESLSGSHAAWNLYLPSSISNKPSRTSNTISPFGQSSITAH